MRGFVTPKFKVEFTYVDRDGDSIAVGKVREKVYVTCQTGSDDSATVDILIEDLPRFIELLKQVAGVD